ncbi:glycosyltransferase involved in cell wall biosynthesis [Winogradskyella pacifica]|uniref:Glycosyltransferase involved in cell wall biosynthesis n=1 Tax=Winogradskyella pacifica TaxID=664642 RepID=A0A3D9N9L4_9FLAO|nr:glycosyltransferase family 2 protein [Winogradskyella pacifica]REE27209.1 glycosyltransferase involved in cell wall biosynthesis [Winogradskyella pacifica]
MAFFSVIISVYNKENYIQHTIKSVLNQSFKDFEVIIINDGSTDKSEAVINSFDDYRIRLLCIKNQGASNARNTGIKTATTDYIALLDGDDTWDASYLQYMFDAITAFPNINIFSAAIAQKYENKVVPVPYSFKQTELYGVYNYFKASKKYTLLTSSSVVFKKSVIEKSGVFDTSLITGEDTDMWIRFGLHFEILFINKLLTYYHHDDYSLSNTNFDLEKKPNFDSYFEYEKTNSSLKDFLDRNRYSMAVLSKLQNDNKSFLYYTSHLDRKNISIKQRLLLKSPKWLLQLLLKLQSLKGERLIYPKS